MITDQLIVDTEKAAKSAPEMGLQKCEICNKYMLIIKQSILQFIHYHRLASSSNNLSFPSKPV